MEPANNSDEKSFSQQVGEKENRMLKARRENKRSVWFGLGMFGMVGWSVVVPTLLGVITGRWLDDVYPETFSWTLTLMIAGLSGGCMIAWHWVAKEFKEMNENKNDGK